MALTFSSGTTPLACNPEAVITEKILIKLNAGGGTGGGGSGSGLSGVGSPQGVVTASPGTTYLQTDTGSFWAKQTGTDANGWIELIA